jgi:hypothetical protein
MNPMNKLNLAASRLHVALIDARLRTGCMNIMIAVHRDHLYQVQRVTHRRDGSALNVPLHEPASLNDTIAKLETLTKEDVA